MTSVFEHFLMVDGWQSREAKKNKKRECSCWISPDGKWYNVPYCEHQMFAYYVVKDIYSEELTDHIGKDFQNAGDVLVKRGWILIHPDYGFGTLIRGWKQMTPKQYKVLYAYFKNQRLFRGWTIPLLYREKKGA